MPFWRIKGEFGIDKDEEQMISGQLRQLHLIIVWFGFVLLPWRKDFVLRKATLNLRMEILSSFETMFDSKGRMEARWSNSPLKRCLVEPDMVMIKMVLVLVETKFREVSEIAINLSLASSTSTNSQTGAEGLIIVHDHPAMTKK